MYLVWSSYTNVRVPNDMARLLTNKFNIILVKLRYKSLVTFGKFGSGKGQSCLVRFQIWLVKWNALMSTGWKSQLNIILTPFWHFLAKPYMLDLSEADLYSFLLQVLLPVFTLGQSVSCVSLWDGLWQNADKLNSWE